MEYGIKEERLSAREYIDFLKETNLGVVRIHTGQGIGKALIKNCTTWQEERIISLCILVQMKMLLDFIKSWV